MTHNTPEQAPLRVLIIGAGFAGLGLAMRLRQQGHEDFLILEKGEEAGGTWRDNHYPGAACDVPSHLYSFSFAPNPRWSRAYARIVNGGIIRPGDEIRVLRDEAAPEGATGAVWSEEAKAFVVPGGNA